MYVKGGGIRGRSTYREEGLVEWREWQGSVMPCGLRAGHSFLIVHTLQVPQHGPTDLDLSTGSNDFLSYETCKGSGYS